MGESRDEEGLSHGVAGFVDDVDLISRGKNDVIENITGSCRDSDKVQIIRLECWRVFARTAVYINERLVGYSSPLWRAARAEISVEEAVAQLERNPFCCAPSSFDRKALLYLSKFEGRERFNLRESLKAVLISARTEFNKKGGSSSKRIEFLFSIVRMIGLKCPIGHAPSLCSFVNFVCIRVG